MPIGVEPVASPSTAGRPVVRRWRMTSAIRPAIRRDRSSCAWAMTTGMRSGPSCTRALSRSSGGVRAGYHGRSRTHERRLTTLGSGRAPAPELPAAVDRTAGLDGRLDDAERGHPVAGLAAGAALPAGPCARDGRTGAAGADRRVLAGERGGGRRPGPAPADARDPDRHGGVRGAAGAGRL